MSDSNLVEQESLPPCQELPSLLCPYSGRRARARKYVKGDLVQYAADDQPPFLVPASSLNDVEDSKLDLSSFSRRVLRWVESTQ